jgi:hypothetical protein
MGANSSTMTINKSLTIPSNTAVGNYYLFFWADGGNCVTSCTTCYGNICESDECNNFASVPLTVCTPPPASITASGTTNFCIGGYVTLYANTGTGLTYQWQKNNANIPGANSTSYYDTVSGNFKVKITNSLGCKTLSNVITVNKYGETNVCPEPWTDFGTLNITATGAKVKWRSRTCAEVYTVQYRPVCSPTWTQKQINTNTAYKYLTGLSPSTAYEWKVRTKCDTVNAIYSIYSPFQNFTTLSLLAEEYNNNESEDLTIYPNSNSGQFSLEFNSEVKGNGDIIEIFNSVGQLVFKNSVTINEGENQKEIDLSKFPSGIYFLKLNTETRTYRQKIIKN